MGIAPPVPASAIGIPLYDTAGQASGNGSGNVLPLLTSWYHGLGRNCAGHPCVDSIVAQPFDPTTLNELYTARATALIQVGRVQKQLQLRQAPGSRAPSLLGRMPRNQARPSSCTWLTPTHTRLWPTARPSRMPPPDPVEPRSGKGERSPIFLPVACAIAGHHRCLETRWPRWTGASGRSWIALSPRGSATLPWLSSPPTTGEPVCVFATF